MPKPKQIKIIRRKLPKRTLEDELCEILSTHAGERGYSEGAAETLCRILAERNRALLLLALDRLKGPAL